MHVCTAFIHRGEDGGWMLPLPFLCRRLAALAGLAAGLIFGLAGSAAAQATDADPQAQAPADPAMFPHPDKTRYFTAGQAHIILQSHGPVQSSYEGTNSLLARGEYKTSLVGTLFMGKELVRNPARHLRAIYDEESSGGRGISEALGLAGFTNLDVVRNPTLGPGPYLARVELHQ